MVEKKTPLVFAAFTTKEKTDRAASREQKLKLLVSVLVFVCDSYLFCDSCRVYVELWKFEIIKPHKCCLAFEYDEYFKL